MNIVICTEKTLRNVDAVLDCIPLVSSVSNLAQLASKVNFFNPVSSGFPMTLKIHALSKSSFECCVGLIPVLGNLIKLVQLVSRTLSRSQKEESYLEKAILQRNSRIFGLCLRNGISKETAKKALLLAARGAAVSHTVFVDLLYYRNQQYPSSWGGESLWEAEDLLAALSACRFQGRGVSETERKRQEEKVDALIGLWTLKKFPSQALPSEGLRERILCHHYSDELRGKMEAIFFPKPPENPPIGSGKPSELAPRTSWFWGKYKTTS